MAINLYKTPRVALKDKMDVPSYASSPGMPSAPSWWKPSELTASTNPQSFANIANTVIPFLTGPDQEAVRVFLASEPNSGFGGYLSGIGSQTGRGQPYQGTIAPLVTSSTERQLLGAERAKALIAKLEQMRNTAKLSENQLGPGYKFLLRAADLLRQFGATGNAQSITRADFEQLKTQLSTLTEQAMSNRTLAPFAELARQFISPTVMGELMPSSTVGGNTVYGRANKKLFG